MNDQDLKKIRVVVKEEIGSSEKRVLGEIGRFVEDELLPAIEEKAYKTDQIDRIERKLDYFTARVMEHGYRLDTIESVPTVAQNLVAGFSLYPIKEF